MDMNRAKLMFAILFAYIIFSYHLLYCINMAQVILLASAVAMIVPAFMYLADDIDD